MPGRILALAADPRNDAVIYAGTPGGGVWKTQNGGLSWTPLQTGTTSQVCFLAVDPRVADVVYLGTGDDQSPRPAQGIARSTNGGQSWTFQPRFTNQPVCTIAIDPANSERILAGSSEGLFLSSDSGSTWMKVLNTGVTSVAFDGAGSVYAGVVDNDAAGTRDRILAHSSDGGLTWTNLPLAPNPFSARTETNWVSVVANLETVSVVVSYQTTSTETTSTVAGRTSSPLAPLSQLDSYHSADRGTTWSPKWGLGMARPPVRLAAEPTTRNLYLAGTSLLVQRPSANWSAIPTSTSEFHTSTFTGGLLMLGGESGLEVIGLNDSVPIPSIAQLPGGQFFGTAFDPVSGIWAAGPGGLYHLFPLTGLPDVRLGGVGRVGNVAAAATPNIFSAGNDAVYRSTDAGARFSPRTVIASGELRALVPPFAVDPALPSTSYVAGRRLYRTTDNGNSWTALAIVDPDPTRVVAALAIAPTARMTMVAATACLPEVATVSCANTSLIWRSTNGGSTWIQVSSLPGVVNRLSLDSRLSTTIYAAIGGFPAGTSLSAGFVDGNLFRSTDNGTTWVSIRNNLPQVPVNTIVIDPASLPAQLNLPAQKLYAGTDAGVFVSFNAGAHWTDISGSFIRSLPSTPVTDLSIRSDGTLLAATFGRGIYFTSTTGLAAGLIVSSLSLNVTLVEGTTTTTGISLTNGSTTNTFGWALSAIDSWISAPVSSGTLRPNASLQVAIQVSAATLKAGDYRGRLQMVSGSYAQTIHVNLRVTPAPAQIRIVGNAAMAGAPGTALPALQVVVLDARDAPIPGIPVTFAIASGGGFLSARTVSTNAAGIAGTTLTLPSTPGTVRVVATTGEISTTVIAIALPAPTVLTDGVLDGVTLNAYTPLGPGSIVSVSGSNLARAAIIAPTSPLPPSLQDTRIVLTTSAGEVSLPLLSASPVQVRGLVPYDISPGVYPLRVEVGSARSNTVQISIAAFGPGIFTRAGNGRGAGTFMKLDGSLVTATNPADRGSTVSFFASGLGPITPPIAAGQPGALREPLNRTVTVPRVFFDNHAAEVIYSGLAPGAAGRYQITVRVPAALTPATNISLSVTLGGFASNRVTIPVR